VPRRLQMYDGICLRCGGVGGGGTLKAHVYAWGFPLSMDYPPGGAASPQSPHFSKSRTWNAAISSIGRSGVWEPSKTKGGLGAGGLHPARDQAQVPAFESTCYCCLTVSPTWWASSGDARSRQMHLLWTIANARRELGGHRGMGRADVQKALGRTTAIRCHKTLHIDITACPTTSSTDRVPVMQPSNTLNVSVACCYPSKLQSSF
jgi:hypothetical protein